MTDKEAEKFMAERDPDKYLKHVDDCNVKGCEKAADVETGTCRKHGGHPKTCGICGERTCPGHPLTGRGLS